MDKASGVYYLRTNSYIQVADDAYPSVASIVNKAVSQASKRQMVLNTKWLSIFTTGFSISLSTTIRSSGLRQKALLRGGLGTCQAYESAYAKLLSAAGIENAKPAMPMMGTRGMRSSSMTNGIRLTALGMTRLMIFTAI